MSHSNAFDRHPCRSNAVELDANLRRWIIARCFTVLTRRPWDMELFTMVTLFAYGTRRLPSNMVWVHCPGIHVGLVWLPRQGWRAPVHVQTDPLG
ncbi:MAG: hypothetical protein AAFU85_16295 [Planctomycetota bacterium]